jgi:aryl-alcohol dehydrogenase-like predicted oxidoreductase
MANNNSGIPLRTLGDTGIKVSVLCLGAMMFGDWGNKDHNDSIKIIHKAIDKGINFIDTADVYSQGESEKIVGKALKGKRKDIILATKVHGQMGGNPNHQGNSRRWIMEEVDHSLMRLQTDYIDLYQIHRPDPNTDIDETLGALTDLVRMGKIRAFGSSTFPASQIVEAQWVAEKRGRERFRCEQPPYSMLIRGIESDILPTIKKYGMGTIVWSPLAGGWLSGKWQAGKDAPSTNRAKRRPDIYDLNKPGNKEKLAAADKLNKLAENNGMTLVELAVAFTINHPAVTSAIIGPRTMEQLTTQLSAANIKLDNKILDEIDKIVPPGTNASPYESAWDNWALHTENLRRR